MCVRVSKIHSFARFGLHWHCYYLFYSPPLSSLFLCTICVLRFPISVQFVQHAYKRPIRTVCTYSTIFLRCKINECFIIWLIDWWNVNTVRHISISQTALYSCLVCHINFSSFDISLVIVVVVVVAIFVSNSSGYDMFGVFLFIWNIYYVFGCLTLENVLPVQWIQASAMDSPFSKQVQHQWIGIHKIQIS